MPLTSGQAPWCGHCKKLAPEWDAAADELAEAGERGVLTKVDCTENQELCARFGVRGYLTLKLFVYVRTELDAARGAVAYVHQ